MTDYIDIDQDEAKEILNDLDWIAAGKKPLFSQIMVGYMLSKAVWFFCFFIDKAISCIDMSVVDMNEDNTPIDNLEVYELKAQLLEVKATVLRMVGTSHNLAAETLHKKGYGSLTSQLFKLLGIGVIPR
jgi:hypothetical protein